MAERELCFSFLGFLRFSVVFPIGCSFSCRRSGVRFSISNCALLSVFMQVASHFLPNPRTWCWSFFICSLFERYSLAFGRILFFASVWIRSLMCLRIHDKKNDFFFTLLFELEKKKKKCIAEFGRKFNSTLCIFRCVQILRVLGKWLCVYLYFFFSLSFETVFWFGLVFLILFPSSFCVRFTLLVRALCLQFNTVHSIEYRRLSVYFSNEFCNPFDFVRYTYTYMYIYIPLTQCVLCVEKRM